MAAKLRVTQVKSTISHIARNRATIRALGLKRIGDTVEVTDNAATRGMVRQVRFLVSVQEIADAAPAGSRGKRAAAAEAPPVAETAATGPTASAEPGATAPEPSEETA
jgi:large subunit ribosomal protein L30